MSFGYSIGDFFAGANLSYQLIKALSSSRGASIEYQEAIAELGCLQQTFLQVGRMTTNPTLSPATINAASHIVLSSMSLIGDFFERTKRYRESLCDRGSRHTVSDSWQKMGWVLFKKEELTALTNALHVKLSSISVLLSTAKFNERMPTQVAQYQVITPVNPSPPPPSYTHLAEEDPTLIRPFRPAASETLEATSALKEEPLDNIKNSKFEARFARLEEMMGKQRIRDTTTPIEVYPQEEVNESILELDLNAVGSAPSQVPDLPSDVTQQEEVGLFTRFDSFLKAQRKLEVHDTRLVTDFENLMEKHTSRSLGASSIKFKDAVGRKFTFPFHLASTWAGMEELVRQAFLHVEVIGPHVVDGHYDLIGPDGEIILPQVWETMIKPNWSVTMHMWPMPEPRPGPPPVHAVGEWEG